MTIPGPVRPPAGRYGPERTGRPPAVLLWVLGALAVALALWLGARVGSTPVSWQDVGFTLRGATEVEVAYEVIRPDPSVAVRCRIQALNHQYGEVGALVVDVPRAAQTTARLRSTVATSEAAVTGIVDSCWVP